MEKIDRSCLSGEGKKKFAYEATEEVWDKLDEIVDWINIWRRPGKWRQFSVPGGSPDYEQGVRDAVHKSKELRELLLGAFVAETGALPSECVILEETVDGKRITKIVKAGD